MTSVRTPSFAPDGRALYYVSNRGGSFDLWLQAMQADGRAVGDPERLTTGVGMSTAAVSRDGSKLAYPRGLGLIANAWRVPLRTDRRVSWSDAQQLTSDEAFIEFIDLSPNRSELFLSSNRRGNQDLWRMPASGGDMQQITSDPAPASVDLAGRQANRVLRLSFGQPRHLDHAQCGGPARQVTTHESGDYHPVWSPDGSRIAFASTRSGAFNVMVVAARRRRAHRRGHQSWRQRANWSPDGRWIAFQRSTPEGSRFFRIPATGGQTEQITRGGGNGLARRSPNGKTLYYVRGITDLGSEPPDWRRASTDGIRRKGGNVGQFSLATDGTYLYFAWQESQADLWTMDVARQ